jgi:hypothetical protein
MSGKTCTKFGIDESVRMVTTPLLSSYRPQQYEGQATLHQITEMQEKVGSVLYAAVVSRPDVSFAVSQLSQFIMNPSPEHLRYANRVLAYFQGTKYYAASRSRLSAVVVIQMLTVPGWEKLVWIHSMAAHKQTTAHLIHAA